MWTYRQDKMLKLIALAAILMIVSSINAAGENNTKSMTFEDAAVSLNDVQKVTIFYVDVMDQRQMSSSELRQAAAAKLIIDCGSSCAQNLPRIIGPMKSANRIERCPRAEIMLIIDFDNGLSIEYFRGANIFRSHGACYGSAKSGKVLLNIFDFFRQE